MKVLYDTSVLIPALLTKHENHAIAFPQLQIAKREEVQGHLSTHTLAELYSVTTRLPKPIGISAESASEMVLDLLEYLVSVELSAMDYRKAIARTTKQGLSGGVMYDAVIAQAALKAKVDRLITLNPKDFRRLGDDVSEIVYVPEG